MREGLNRLSAICNCDGNILFEKGKSRLEQSLQRSIVMWEVERRIKA